MERVNAVLLSVLAGFVVLHLLGFTEWFTNVRLWLQGDIQRPVIDFRFAPSSGHSEAHAGLPFVTHNGHW